MSNDRGALGLSWDHVFGLLHFTNNIYRTTA